MATREGDVVSTQGQDKLKPCPFCGGEAGTDFDFFGKSELTRYFVYCSDCGASSPVSETTEQAIEAWNPRQRIEAMEKALRQDRAVMLKAAEDKEAGRMWNISYPLSAAAAKIASVLDNTEESRDE